MVNYNCPRCNYTVTQKNSMRDHLHRKTICKPILRDIILDNYKEKILNREKIDFLDGIFCICGHNCENIQNHNNHILQCQTKKEIEELKRKIKELETQINIGTQINGDQNNITNNITINLQVNDYKKTSLEHLTDKHYKHAISKILMSIPKMIEHTHFNKRAPENHNIYISNIRNKFIMVYDGENWQIRDQDEMIDKLISDQEYAIEEWFGEGDKFPNEMKKFNTYLDTKEKDGAIDAMKKEIKLLLYNKRNMIKK